MHQAEFHSESVTQPPADRDPLAIIGIGCRFPGQASDPNRFWQFLVSGCDGFKDIPKDRWNIARFHDPDNVLPGMTNIRQAAFLEEPIDLFDAYFFGITPREAEGLDPQQRLLLEVSWEAFEDAGLAPSRIAGSPTGVYVGGFTVDALQMHLAEANRELIGPHTATSATLGMLAARLSYYYDLRGPSFTVDTACSSSLVAFHYACSDLWSGRTALALAGGVNVMFKPEFPIAMSKGGFLASDARSKAFDHRANGYARGEGAGIVVLKRLADALQDGDRVYALVRGTGVNQDGRTDGITVPAGDAQESLIRAVYEEAGIDPSDVGYLEAHGTGTAVGDPTEASSLGRVLKGQAARRAPCLIGSVKANIGHLEAGAGVAGVIKAALCLHHREVPPQIQIERLNPDIPFEDLGLRVPLAREPLRRDDRPLYASVNSFGYGGTNAHAALQALPPNLDPQSRMTPRRRGPPYFLPVSARNGEALAALGERYAERIASDPAAIDDLCYSASRRRSHLSHRFAAVAADDVSLREQLRTLREKNPVDSAAANGPVFVFTGMGPQWWGMGRELLDREPAFRDAAQKADAAFARHSGWSVLAEMGAEAKASRITRNFVAQPANFVLQVALTALWESWGIRPAAIVGHSVGEVPASYIAGGLSLEDAALVSFHRSSAHQKAAGAGKMLATDLDSESATQLIREHGGDIDIAGVNSPTSVALSGDAAALTEIAQILTAESIFNRFLKVEVPYHSRFLDPLQDEILSPLSPLAPKPVSLPLYSTVSGRKEDGILHDNAYWWRNFRHPVRFAEAIQGLLADGFRSFLEIGPHPVLGGAIKQTSAAAGHAVIVLSSLHRECPEAQTMLEALGGLYMAGLDIDFSGLFPGGRFTPLPLYPWQKERFWNESERSSSDRTCADKHPLLGRSLDEPGTSWLSTLGALSARYIRDHRVQGSVVFPAAGFVEMALAASRDVAEDERQRFVIHNLRFQEPLIIPAHAKPLLKSVWSAENRRLQVFGRLAGQNERWTLLADAKLSAAAPKPGHAKIDGEAALREQELTAISVEEFYRELKARGLEYGPCFRGIEKLLAGSKEVFAEIALPAPLSADDNALLHPTILDSAFQALFASVGGGDDGAGEGVYIPVSINRFVLHALAVERGQRYHSHGRIRGVSKESLNADILISDERGDLIAEVQGLHCQRVSAGTEETDSPNANRLYAYAWQAVSNLAAASSQILHLQFLDPDGLVCAAAEDIAAPESLVRIYPDPRGQRAAEVQGVIEQDEDHCVVFVGRKDTEDPTGERECLRLLAVVQRLSVGATRSPRLIVAVQDLHGIDGGVAGAPAQASIWGLGRTLLAEHPEFRITLIDLPLPAAESARALLAELRSAQPEEEVAWRHGQRFVHRLERLQSSDSAAEERIRVSSDHPFVLDSPFGKGIENLSFRESSRRAPEQGELELRFTHVALNFKDVLKMMGVLPARLLDGTFFERSVGMEAAARVVDVGPDVTAFAPGDAVIATVGGGCMRSFATAPLHHVHALPVIAGYSPAVLSGCPIVFITAYYGLHEIARVQPGENVLIHSAAGGVGWAALQVARWLGATVIATAGTDEKRRHLRNHGVEHVLDSRSLSYVQDVLELTGGEGVDVILNFLTGEALDLNLEILRPFGRLVEIGKRDIEQDRGLPMGAFDKNVTFAAIDIDRMLALKPELFDQMYAAVWERIKAGDFVPAPITERPLSELSEACRTMMGAEHIGKLVLRIEGEEVEVSRRAQAATPIRSDASYLVTGGLSGFGAVLAKWLVKQGARHLILIGRRGLATPGAGELVAELESQAAQVHVHSVNVADAGALRQLFATFDPTAPPLRGIFHAAGVLDDGLVSNMTAAQFQRVMRSKATGAWHLHVLSEQLPLEHFVLFSSISALVGNAGQANYVAANCFLDALARRRRSNGLAGLSINWGVIGEVGMVARDHQLEAHFEHLGLSAMSPADALSAMAPLLQESEQANVGIADIDWGKWAQSGAVGSMSRFAEVATSAAPDSGPGAIVALLEEMAPGERRSALAEIVAEQIAEVLRMPVEKLPLSQPLKDLGVDSLMTVELQLTLRRTFGVEVPALELARIGGVAPLADLMLGSIMTSSAGAKDAAPAALESEGDDSPRALARSAPVAA